MNLWREPFNRSPKKQALRICRVKLSGKRTEVKGQSFSDLARALLYIFAPYLSSPYVYF